MALVLSMFLHALLIELSSVMCILAAGIGSHDPGDPVRIQTRFSFRYMQLPALRHMVAEEGARSLWHGLQPRVLFHMPAAAVCWGTYESVKRLLTLEDLVI